MRPYRRLFYASHGHSPYYMLQKHLYDGHAQPGFRVNHLKQSHQPHAERRLMHATYLYHRHIHNTCAAQRYPDLQKEHQTYCRDDVTFYRCVSFIDLYHFR
nr:MAG TPA: hypothetical protein [Bacteriophage sp.]